MGSDISGFTDSIMHIVYQNLELIAERPLVIAAYNSRNVVIFSLSVIMGDAVRSWILEAWHA